MSGTMIDIGLWIIIGLAVVLTEVYYFLFVKQDTFTIKEDGELFSISANKFQNVAYVKAFCLLGGTFTALVLALLGQALMGLLRLLNITSLSKLINYATIIVMVLGFIYIYVKINQVITLEMMKKYKRKRK